MQFGQLALYHLGRHPRLTPSDCWALRSGAALRHVVAEPRLETLVGDSDHDLTGKFDASLAPQSGARAHVEDAVQTLFLEFVGFGKKLRTVFNPHMARCTGAHTTAVGANWCAGKGRGLEQRNAHFYLDVDGGIPKCDARFHVLSTLVTIDQLGTNA